MLTPFICKQALLEDAEDRLIAIDQRRGSQQQRIEFKYDPLGRRVRKRCFEQGRQDPTSITQFHWQGLRLLQEIQNDTPSLYLYSEAGSHEPLTRVDTDGDSSSIAYFHTNLAGLAEQLTDEHGHALWHSDYQGWGRSRDEWHRPGQTRQQNLRMQGQYLDRETGLHYNLYRYYDPGIGRFTQHDPIGVDGGLNLYAYAPTPLTWTDPCGLVKCPVAKIMENASKGKVRRGSDYHGRLGHEREAAILSEPEGVFKAKNGNLIFHKDGNIVVTHGKGAAQGNVITSYGTGGPRGESGAAIYGGSASDPGMPITRDMILKGEIPRPNGGFLPPASEIPLGD